MGSNRHIEESARTADAAFARRVVTLLVGATSGWLIVAIAHQVAVAFRCGQPNGLPVMSACFGAIALGVRLPQRIAGAMAHRQRREKHESAADRSLPDRQLLWTILAASAMLAGLGIAAIPVMARAGAWAHAVATEHFFWLDAMHVLLVTVLSLIVVAVPLVLVGVVVVCLNQLARFAPRSPERAVPRLLAAAAVGSVLASQFSETGSRPELLVVLAALPFFAVAILAARRFGVGVRGEVDAGQFRPAVGFSQPNGTLESIVTVTTIAVAGIVVLWSWLLATKLGAVGTYSVLCAAALGLSGVPARGGGEAYGVAMPIALAGLFGIVAAMTVALVSDAIGVVMACVISSLAVLAVTRAMRHARRRVLECTASPNAKATRQLFELWWWPGVALLAIAIFSPSERACYWCLVGLGLAVVAAGAVASLDDAARAFGRRCLSAAMVLVAAMGLTVWMPWVASRWALVDDRFSVPEVTPSREILSARDESRDSDAVVVRKATD